MRWWIINISVWVLFAFASFLSLRAENEMKAMTELTQFNLSPSLYNPAYTGDVDFLRVRLAGRLQSVGLEKYPKNFFASVDVPFQIGRSNIGAGITVSKLNYDVYSNFVVDAQGSYHFKVGSGFFSAGLNLGYFHTRFDSELIADSSEDAAPEGEENHPDSSETGFEERIKGDRFDIGLGLAYFTKDFRIGVSILHLNSPRVSDRKLSRVLYFESGGNIELKPALLSLQPSVLFSTDFSDFHGEISLGATIKNILNLGVAYRLREAVAVMAGISYKNFMFGYSYDLPAGRLTKGSKGSHELVVGYQFKLDFSKKSPYSQKSIRIM